MRPFHIRTSFQKAQSTSLISRHHPNYPSATNTNRSSFTAPHQRNHSFRMSKPALKLATGPFKLIETPAHTQNLTVSSPSLRPAHSPLPTNHKPRNHTTNTLKQPASWPYPTTSSSAASTASTSKHHISNLQTSQTSLSIRNVGLRC
jgi:hypothetical protein